MTSSNPELSPKAELHCHLDGLIGPALLRRLRMRGIDLGVDPEALEAVLPVESWSDWVDRYAPRAMAATTPPRKLVHVLVQHVADLRAQYATYAEVFLTGLLGEPDPGALAALFAEARAAVDAAEEGAIQVEFVVCIGRASPERAARQVDKILSLHARDPRLVRGVALAGDEGKCTVRSLASAFDALHDAGLGVEIHAGETSGAESIRDALDYGRPHRLGHALSLFDDPALVDLVLTRGVHVEYCPSSNTKVGQAPDLHRHPLARALAAGVPFSINTDDPGPFQCTLTSEIRRVAEAFGLGAEDLARVHGDTLAAAFAPVRRAASA